MKLLLDEMYPATLAEQLRARGHDVVSIHDPDYRRLEGAPDAEVFAAAVAETRVLVTENVPVVSATERVLVEELGQGFYRVTAHYGFMQNPNVLKALRRPMVMKAGGGALGSTS